MLFRSRALVEPGKAIAVYLRAERSTGPWSARWTGSIEVPVTGRHQFHTFSNDGIRLWIDDQKLIDDWTDHGEKEDTGQITLESGKNHSLTIEYFYNGGQGVTRFWWTPPGGRKEPVPQTALRRPAGGTGLRGEYFHRIELNRPWAQRDDLQVNFTWGTKPPLEGLSRSAQAPLQIELGEGDWEAAWVDTKSGEVVRTARVPGDGIRSFEVPDYESDIALRLDRRQDDRNSRSSSAAQRRP